MLKILIRKNVQQGNGHPVTVLIEEDGIITDCSLKTQEPDELLDFHLEPENVLNKVVLQTELLKDILSELDSSSDLIEVKHNLMFSNSIISPIILHFDNFYISQNSIVPNFRTHIYRSKLAPLLLVLYRIASLSLQQ